MRAAAVKRIVFFILILPKIADPADTVHFTMEIDDAQGFSFYGTASSVGIFTGKVIDFLRLQISIFPGSIYVREFDKY